MSLFSWFFAKKYNEKDNMGTRHDDIGIANAYWIARQGAARKDPFTLYRFQDAAAARVALLELPCIHVAMDTGERICTEVLVFGHYDDDDSEITEAIVAGSELTPALWAKAKSSFERHGGVCRNELEPSEPPRAKRSPKGTASQVKFIREDRQIRHGRTLTYRVHRGPNGAAAKAFLESKPVTEGLLYLVVETPEGNFCRDVQGIYTE